MNKNNKLESFEKSTPFCLRNLHLQTTMYLYDPFSSTNKNAIYSQSTNDNDACQNNKPGHSSDKVKYVL
jgi:hypothetical protein